MNDIELIKKYVAKELQEDALKKLKSGYPVQYIIGNVEFYGNIIEVNENVLIPRFETEYLVDKTLKYMNYLKINNPNILEIGTGSGCISIGLKKSITCNITAIDISKNALEIAQKNAFLNHVAINFIECDLNKFNTIETYDLIISNPPYVPNNSVVDEKTKYEPQIAIFAEDDGLYFYKQILTRLKDNLKENYLIAFEIGDKEGKAIIKMVNEYLPKAYVILEKDYNGYERYLFISNKIIEN